MTPRPTSKQACHRCRGTCTNHRTTAMSFKTAIDRQRRIAITQPCQFAEQCADGRYMFTVNAAQGTTCGVNLTVNIGEE